MFSHPRWGPGSPPVPEASVALEQHKPLAKAGGQFPSSVRFPSHFLLSLTELGTEELNILLLPHSPPGAGPSGARGRPVPASSRGHAELLGQGFQHPVTPTSVCPSRLPAPLVTRLAAATGCPRSARGDASRQPSLVPHRAARSRAATAPLT